MRTLRTATPIRLLFAVLVLLATAGLAYVLRDLVREVIVLPLSYATWMLGLLLRSVPQSVLLAVVILLCALLALRGLTRGRPATRFQVAAPDTRPEPSRLTFWRRQFRNAPNSGYAADKLTMELRNLTYNALAHDLRIDRGDVERMVKAGEIELPPAVRTALLSESMWNSGSPMDDLGHALAQVRAAVSRLFRLPPEFASTKRDAALTAVLEFVESRLGSANVG
jgi:hypothetical protein